MELKYYIDDLHGIETDQVNQSHSDLFKKKKTRIAEKSPKIFLSSNG